MTMNEDPPRLLEPGSTAGAELREVLRVASTSGPSAEQLQALAQKIAVASAVPAGFGAALGVKAWFAKGGALKLSAWLLIASTGAWFGWRATREHSVVHESMPMPRAQSAAPAAIEVTPAAPPAAPAGVVRRELGFKRKLLDVPRPASAKVAQPESMTAGPSHAPGAPVAPKSTKEQLPRALAVRPRAVAVTPRMPTVVGAPGLPELTSTPPAEPKAAATQAEPTASELELLSRAQHTLARDPAAALAILEQHARSYPHGAYEQEREALAIDALRRLGQRAALQARARAFRERFPNSPHRDRIEALLQ